MYTKNKNISENVLPKFCKENGFLDSKLLRELKKLPVAGEYIISTQECRADLYANDIWGDPSLAWMLPIYNGTTIYSMLFGTTIKYPSKNDIKNLIASL